MTEPIRDDVVRFQISRWAEELVDLSRRNRLLYFAHTRSASFEFVQDSPRILERLENGRSRPWSFFMPEPPDEDGVVSSQTPDHLDLVVAPKMGKWRPEIERGLKALDSKAKAEFLDTGLSVLYLGLGRLSWRDIDGRDVASPLLMVPVLLERAQGTNRFHLRGNENGEPALNPALALKLERDFDIEIPTLDDLTEPTYEETVSMVRRKVASTGWGVDDTAVLAAFSFQKEVMYRDLRNNQDTIAGHPTVRLLAEGPGSETQAGLAFSPVSDDELEQLHPPEELSLILDADGTQRICVAAAQGGHSFVMDGPPGTGKSQTIANMIAQLIRDGNTVLFVSEKAAALEVVQRRLEADEISLGPFLLPLHSHKATRRAVAEELGRTLNLRPKATVSFSPGERDQLQKERRRLSSYAIAMNEVRQPLGRDLHWAIGRVCILEAAGLVEVDALSGDISTVSGLGFQERMDAAGQLGRAWGPVTRGSGFVWRDADTSVEPSVLESRAKRVIPQARGALAVLSDRISVIAREIDLPADQTMTGAHHLVAVLELEASMPDITTEWATAEDLEPCRSLATTLIGAIAHRDQMAVDLDGLGISTGGLNAEMLERLTAATRRGRAEPHAPLGHLSYAQVKSTKDLMDRLCQRLDEVAPSVELLCDQLDVGLDAQLQLLERLVDMARLTGERELPQPGWISADVADALIRARDVLSELVTDFRGRRDNLAGIFREDVLALDLPSLNARFVDLHTGFRKLGRAYRGDKRLLASATLLGKVTDETIQLLPDTIQWQECDRALAKAEEIHAGLLQAYYPDRNGVDLSALERAIEVTEKALSLARQDVPLTAVADIFDNEQGTASALRYAADEVVELLGEVELIESSGWLGDKPGLDLHSTTQLRLWAAEISERCELLANIFSAGEELPEELTVDRLEELVRGVSAHGAAVSTLAVARTAAAPLGGNVAMTENPDVVRAATSWVGSLHERLGGAPSKVTVLALRSRTWSMNDLRPQVEAVEAAIDQVVGLFSRGRELEIREDLVYSFSGANDILASLEETANDIHEWAAFDRAKTDLTDFGMAEVVDSAVKNRAPADSVPAVLEAAFLRAWIEQEHTDDKRLTPRRAVDRDSLRASFRELDRRLIRNSAAEVINACADRRPLSNAGGAGVIQQQAQLKRRHKPVRALLEQAGVAAQALKPCFMMSPMSVSQFLPPSLRFDVVIFDEASQVREADAIGCIYRGDRLIVAGDQKQLPPTSFFQRSLDESDEPLSGDENDIDLQEFESVLDRCKAQGFTSLPLRWHYRSRHEDLITFSNRSFYDPPMHTFPGAIYQSEDLGVELFSVDGVYQRGGMRDNAIEASKVIDRVLFHRRNHPGSTIGVVALSSAQASAVEAELERRSASEPELREIVTQDRLSGFFIKNLENVQGDERDIIIMTIGYGPDENGKLTMNFGPMNKPGGERRLNVAVTRARMKVEVVASVGAGDIKTTNPTLRHLARYLDYADRGPVALSIELAESKGDAESPFEEDVLRVIRQLGYEAEPQIGVAGYRVDIGVRHPNQPGRFTLGVECDGATYHSSKVARDRDRLRQQVLEGLGWTIHRIWSTAWFTQREQEIKRLAVVIDASVRGDERSSVSDLPEVPAVVMEKVDLDAPPAWVMPWVEPVAAGLPYPMEFTGDRARSEIADRITTIAVNYGPVHKEAVLRALREVFGLGQAGSRMRAAFDSILRSLEVQSRVIIDREFLTGPRTQLRVRAPLGLDHPMRVVSEVSHDERELAVKYLLSDVGGEIELDELRTRWARLFGWRRVGVDIERAFQDAFDAVEAK